MTFEIMERSIRGWVAKVFPGITIEALALHIVSEAVEFARSLSIDGDAIRSEVERSIVKPAKDRPEKELGDISSLVIHAAKKLGSNVVDVTLPVHQINLGRVWGEADPTTGIVEHVEDDEDETLKERPLQPRIGVALIGATAVGMDAADEIALLFGLDSLAAAPIGTEGVKGAFRWAQNNARAVCVIGDDEVASGFVDVKLTDSGETQRVPLTAVGIKSALPWCKVSV